MCSKAAFSAARAYARQCPAHRRRNRQSSLDRPVRQAASRLLDMQDEIVARLAGALNAQLSLPRRDGRKRLRSPSSPRPPSPGGMAQQGRSPDTLAKARNFLGRALTADPNNVDALVGSASTDGVAGAFLFVTDPVAAFVAAEAKLTRALVWSRTMRARMLLGICRHDDQARAAGIAECEHALQLDRNLADAHFLIGVAKVFIGRAEETEAHIAEALRLSRAIRWLTRG